MPDLAKELQSYEDYEEKHEFIFNLYERIREKVAEILVFGPCNNNVANHSSNAYYFKKSNRARLFSVVFSEDDCKGLSAVIANHYFCEFNMPPNMSPMDQYEWSFKNAFIYGTGTCEQFAIVGAYFLALEYEVEVSIETIVSDETHTYIRIHTDPEVIMDFWGSFSCFYNDSITWNECLDSQFHRKKGVSYREELRVNSSQLIDMGTRIFTPENQLIRADMLEKVRAEAEQERAEMMSSKKSVIHSQSHFGL